MAADIALYVYSLRENEIIEKTVSCFLNRLILIFKKRFVRFISEKRGDFDLNGQKNLEHEIIFEDVRTQLYFACYTGEEKMLPAHWHEHLELVYVLEGEMTAYSQDSVYELVCGDLFLANTSEIHYTHHAPWDALLPASDSAGAFKAALLRIGRRAFSGVY